MYRSRKQSFTGVLYNIYLERFYKIQWKTTALKLFFKEKLQALTCKLAKESKNLRKQKAKPGRVWLKILLEGEMIFETNPSLCSLAGHDWSELNVHLRRGEKFIKEFKPRNRYRSMQIGDSGHSICNIQEFLSRLVMLEKILAKFLDYAIVFLKDPCWCIFFQRAPYI